MSETTKANLFLDLSKLNFGGVTRWVWISEFCGIYSDFKFGNGGS